MPAPFFIVPQELQSSARDAASLPAAGHSQRRTVWAAERAAELLARPSACYLVTGYRGVGKSTFLKLMAAKARDMEGPRGSPVVVVEVNGAIPGKDDDRPRLLLRKLQRQLYLELQRAGVLERLPRNLQWELQLAYLQTHSKVEQKTTTTWQQAARWEQKGWLQRKALAGALLVVLEAAPFLHRLAEGLQSGAAWLSKQGGALLSLFRLPTDAVDWLGQALKLPYWVAATLVPVLLAAIEPKWSFGWDRKREQEIASLYDDEVAESTLINLLGRLASAPVAERTLRAGWWRSLRLAGSRAAGAASGGRWQFPPKAPPRLRLIVVIDELDKLESPGKGSGRLDALVHGLKPVLMSGHAHFLLVSGMEDFYRWHDAPREEDNRFTNLFNGHFHIPFMADDELADLFQGLLKDPAAAGEPLLQDFCDCLTFRSRGRPRTFLTLFSAYVRWYPAPQLQFSASQQAEIVLEARIQRALSTVWKDVREWRLMPGVEDLLRTRATECLKRMLSRAGGSFRPEEILSPKDFRLPHDVDYREHAEEILRRLLAEMHAGGLLTDVDDDPEAYRWQEEADAVRLSRSITFVPEDGALEESESKRAQPSGSRAMVPDVLVRLLTASGEQSVPEDLDVALELLEGKGLLHVTPGLRESLATGATGTVGVLGTIVGYHIRETIENRLGWRSIGSRHRSTGFMRDRDGRTVYLYEHPTATETVHQDLLAAVEAGIQRASRGLQIAKEPKGAWILLVNFSDTPASLAGCRLDSLHVRLPFPVHVSVVNELDSEKIARAVEAPDLVLEPSTETATLRAASGNGYVHVDWSGFDDKGTVLYRAVGLGEAIALSKAPPGAVGRFTDLDVTNGVSYVYKVMADEKEQTLIGLTVATPTEQVARPDNRYWWALLQRAADLPLPQTETTEPLVPLQDLISSFGQPMQPTSWNSQLAHIYATMDLARQAADGTAKPTRLGEQVAREARAGNPSDTLLRQMIHHPAIRRLLQSWKASGRVVLSGRPRLKGLFRGEVPTELEWLRYILDQTGAAKVEEGVAYWEPAEPAAATEAAAGADQSRGGD